MTREEEILARIRELEEELEKQKHLFMLEAYGGKCIRVTCYRGTPQKKDEFYLTSSQVRAIMKAYMG